jgi:signal peptidase I
MPSNYQQLAIEIAAKAPAVRLQVHGRSMFPLLQAGESVLVEPVSAKHLQPGDLIAFHHQNEVIMHRLVAIQPEGFITLGDHSGTLDPPVLSENILGRVTAIEKDGQQKSLSGGRWTVIHKSLAWLGWQGFTRLHTGWVARFPRMLFWLVRWMARLSLNL